jgi:hypothetical protein
MVVFFLPALGQADGTVSAENARKDAALCAKGKNCINANRTPPAVGGWQQQKRPPRMAVTFLRLIKDLNLGPTD